MTEQEEIYALKDVEMGEKAKNALEIFDKFFLEQNAIIFSNLLTCPTEDDIRLNVYYMRALNKLKSNINTYISLGEIAEDKLNGSDSDENERDTATVY